jgi:hypothetical protein
VAAAGLEIERSVIRDPSTWEKMRIAPEADGCAEFSDVRFCSREYICVADLPKKQQIPALRVDAVENFHCELLNFGSKFAALADIDGRRVGRNVYRHVYVRRDRSREIFMPIDNTNLFRGSFPDIFEDGLYCPTLQRPPSIILDLYRVEIEKLNIGAIYFDLGRTLRSFVICNNSPLCLQASSDDEPDNTDDEEPKNRRLAAATPINSGCNAYKEESYCIKNAKNNVHSFYLSDVMHMGLGGFLAGAAFGGLVVFLLGIRARR